MTLNEASGLVRQFERLHVLVVGDLMLDEYLWGHIERISPEAPVPILNLARQEHTLGGSGNVVKNLRGLGAQVTVLGVVGDDATGDRILDELDELGVHRAVGRERARTSTRKSRLMSLEHNQQLFRFDQESTHPIERLTEDALLSRIEVNMKCVKAVVCSDYLKGVLTSKLLQATIAFARKGGLPVVIGPKDSDPTKYRGASVLVPNLRELEQLSGTGIHGGESLTRAALRVLQHLQTQSLLVTRGRDGMSLFEHALGSIRQVDMPAVARSVYDVTGAGDTVLSVLTLSIAAGAGYEAAARLANLAAGIVVEKVGTACVTPEEILERLEAREALETILPETRDC